MKVLLLAHVYRKKHNDVVEALEKYLNEKLVIVDKIFNKDEKYDCIIVFNKKYLKSVSKITRIVKIPILYIFCQSDMPTEYLVEWTEFESMIILKDKVHDIRFSLPPNCELVQMPSIYIAKKYNKSIGEKYPILFVDIDNDYLKELIIFRLLLLLNRINNYRVVLYTRINNCKLLFNNHVTIIRDFTLVEEYIRKSSLVIGSGYSILKALYYKKKTIVVGEKGYGGIVSSKNIVYHYLNFFQGRNGGKYDEMIPINLLKNDINKEICSVEKNKIIKILRKLENDNLIFFMSLINKVISAFQLVIEQQDTLLFILNSNCIIEKVGNQFGLFWKFSGILFAKMNESEYTVIMKFVKGATIDNVIKESPEEYMMEIKAFLYELVENKIIVPVNKY